jgi:hypothetical protein
MANIYEPSNKQRALWRKFLKSRPAAVRAVAERFAPWKLYRLMRGPQRVVVVAFDELKDGSITVRVDVRAEFNFVLFERQVFGIKPEDLEECELPGPDEMLGSALTPEQASDPETMERLREFLCAGERPRIN